MKTKFRFLLLHLQFPFVYQKNNFFQASLHPAPQKHKKNLLIVVLESFKSEWSKKLGAFCSRVAFFLLLARNH